MVLRLPPVPAMDALRSLGSAARSAERHRRGRRDGSDDRQHRYPGAPLRSRRKGGTPRQGLGRSRGGFSTKIHLRTNGAGLPVAVDIAPGQASDYTGAIPLLDADGPEPKVLLADRGYDSDHIREEMEARGVTPMIPARRSRKVQIPKAMTPQWPWMMDHKLSPIVLGGWKPGLNGSSNPRRFEQLPRRGTDMLANPGQSALSSGRRLKDAPANQRQRAPPSHPA